MKHRINSLIEEAESQQPSIVRQVSIALVRIMLQHSCLSLLEYLHYTRNRAKGQSFVSPLQASRLRQPSDGTMVEVLSEYLLAAENEGWDGISNTILRNRVEARPASKIANAKRLTVEQILRRFVSVRNDGVEGHGIPGEYLPIVELDVARLLCESVEKLLPTITEENNSYVLMLPNSLQLPIKLLKPVDGNLICYRNIKRLTNGKCKVIAQVQTGMLDREQVSYETPDILGVPDQVSESSYELLDTYDDEWNPITYLPNRLTEKNQFTGRHKELKQLSEWFDDTDSRACMVYGDGGIGKTTLVLEFIHRVLEGKIKTQWLPELITFYTAKQTRWGIDGLERITGKESVGVVDCTIEIVKRLHQPPLSRDWYTSPPEKLTNKLSGYLRQEWNIARNSHLLIFDNTETMASSSEGVEILSAQIKELSRRVGRVLLTSRRLEPLGADPINIVPFSTDESITFLRRRAEALTCRPILQAGRATLRKQADKLGNKPLLLEVFLQSANAPEMSLDRAYQRVQRMRYEDLGEFLFSDAWKRLSSKMRHLLLLMSKTGEIHDSSLLTLCCHEADVTTIEALESLSASRGIANVMILRGNHIQITLSDDFLDFCNDRTEVIHGQNLPSDYAVQRIKRRHRDFLRSSQRIYLDRVHRAFVHPYARAARHAYDEARYDDCDFYYEAAIVEDSKNGWLRDRFAHYLMTRNHLEQAYEQSQKAIELIPADQDAWFTKGMIEARLGHTRNSLMSLSQSEKNGKPPHSCLLQKAYAYLNESPPDKSRARACLDESEDSIPKFDQYRLKHLSEINRVRSRIFAGENLRWHYDSAA